MNDYIAYTRVSTPKQGTQGVSLDEQRDAISRYAERNRLPIGLWLEEMETAAKQGRPVFNQALKLLRSGKARGIILHKLDRGARNLRDWNVIGELSDQGADVHFVTESLDLHSRGGRLSADIQAVVAADYIRNLREETRKGFYGRLKQGLYPLGAPVAYLNHGKGKVKTIDPIMGPLVRRAFELYATASYNLHTLGAELGRLGLRNRRGARLSQAGLANLLHNTFYIGTIYIQKTKETFVGVHEPLIKKSLFDRVQLVLHGKANVKAQRHTFPFRRLLCCAACGYSLIGERQKGRVYYRCHTRECSGTSIREDVIEAEATSFFHRFEFSALEIEYFKARILRMRTEWIRRREDETKSLQLQLAQTKDRLNRLTDAYLDKALDKEMFEERKSKLVSEQKTIQENLANMSRTDQPFPDKLEKFLELAGNASLSHKMAIPEEKREMVSAFTSNRSVIGKKVDLRPSIPFQDIANRAPNTSCPHERTIPRTWDKILDNLIALNTQGLLPDLSTVAGLQKKDTGEEISLEE